MKNISSMAALAALLLVGCGQDTDVKFAGDEGRKSLSARQSTNRIRRMYPV